MTDKSSANGVKVPVRAVTWLQKLQERDNLNRVIVVLLFTIVAILLLHLIQMASLILIPITFAVLLNLLFYPVVQFGRRFSVPPVVTAGGVMVLVVSGFILLLVLVTDPASQWMRELPGVIKELRSQLVTVDGPLSDIKAVGEEIDELAKLDDNKEEPIEVKIEQRNFLQRYFFDQMPIVVTYLGVIIFLTFFLLASGDQLQKKITSLGPDRESRQRISNITQQIRLDVTRYLATISVINFMLGIVVTLAMYLLNVPNPILWGVLAGVLNFAPYVGAAITMGVLTLVGISEFSSLGSALLVPFTFFCITVLEGQLITPLVVGRNLALSPAGVFISVIVWGWIWGMPGALMAVPIVASFKILFENIPSLEKLAYWLEREHRDKDELLTQEPAEV